MTPATILAHRGVVVAASSLATFPMYPCRVTMIKSNQSFSKVNIQRTEQGKTERAWSSKHYGSSPSQNSLVETLPCLLWSRRRWGDDDDGDEEVCQPWSRWDGVTRAFAKTRWWKMESGKKASWWPSVKEEVNLIKYEYSGWLSFRAEVCLVYLTNPIWKLDVCVGVQFTGQIRAILTGITPLSIVVSWNLIVVRKALVKCETSVLHYLTRLFQGQGCFPLVLFMTMLKLPNRRTPLSEILFRSGLFQVFWLSFLCINDIWTGSSSNWDSSIAETRARLRLTPFGFLGGFLVCPVCVSSNLVLFPWHDGDDFAPAGLVTRPRMGDLSRLRD